MEAAHAIGCDLAAEVVATFGQLSLRVSGTSMVPAVLPGDLISIQPVGAAELSPGEIAVFARDGRLVVHRVVASYASSPEQGLITRGDRATHDDAIVSASELIGRVTRIERRGIRVPTRPGLMQQAAGRLLRLSDRATYLYLRLAALPGDFTPVSEQRN